MPTIQERVKAMEVAALNRMKTVLDTVINELDRTDTGYSTDDVVWLIEWFNERTRIDVPFVLAQAGCVHARSYEEAQKLNIGSDLNAQAKAGIIGTFYTILDEWEEELQENLTWDGEGVSVVTSEDGQYGVCRWTDKGDAVLIVAL